MHKSKLFLNFQFFNFVRRNNVKINKNVKINFIEEIKSRQSMLHNHIKKEDMKTSQNIIVQLTFILE